MAHARPGTTAVPHGYPATAGHRQASPAWAWLSLKLSKSSQLLLVQCWSKLVPTLYQHQTNNRSCSQFTDDTEAHTHCTRSAQPAQPKANTFPLLLLRYLPVRRSHYILDNGKKKFFCAWPEDLRLACFRRHRPAFHPARPFLWRVPLAIRPPCATDAASPRGEPHLSLDPLFVLLRRYIPSCEL